VSRKGSKIYQILTVLSAAVIFALCSPAVRRRINLYNLTFSCTPSTPKANCSRLK